MTLCDARGAGFAGPSCSVQFSAQALPGWINNLGNVSFVFARLHNFKSLVHSSKARGDGARTVARDETNSPSAENLFGNRNKRTEGLREAVFPTFSHTEISIIPINRLQRGRSQLPRSDLWPAGGTSRNSDPANDNAHLSFLTTVDTSCMNRPARIGANFLTEGPTITRSVRECDLLQPHQVEHESEF
jgi:hypothetical protein